MGMRLVGVSQKFFERDLVIISKFVNTPDQTGHLRSGWGDCARGPERRLFNIRRGERDAVADIRNAKGGPETAFFEILDVFD